MVTKIKILVFLLTISIAWTSVCAAGSLAEIRSAAEQISSIKGNFIQEKQMAILAHPIVARGYFAYQRPASLRWEYRQPLHSVLLLHNGKAHRFVQSNGEWTEDKAANTQSMDFMLQEITKWLNGRFDDNPMFRVSVEADNKIIMTPKDKSMDQFIQRIELIMADQPGVMKEVVIHENADSYTRFIFIDPKINEPIAPAEFQKVQ